MSDKVNALLDLVRKKKEAIQAQSGRREKTVKPVVGKNRYRILPGWRKGDPTFFQDFGQHFIKGKDGSLKAVYMCSEKTHGTPCEVCSAVVEAIASSSDDDTIKVLTEAKAKGRVLMNALDLTGGSNEEPVILDLTPTTFEKILAVIEEWGDITDLDMGTDIVIERAGKGINTEYSVQPAAKSKPVSISVLGKLHNLDDYVKQEYEAGKTKALVALGQVSGSPALISGSGVSAMLTGPKSSPTIIDIDDEIPSFERKKSDSPLSVGDEEMERLLKELE